MRLWPLVIALSTAAGCCPGPYARARRLPPSTAAQLGAARAELELERTQVGFPPAQDRGARDGAFSQLVVGLRVVEGALPGLRIGPLRLRDQAGHELTRGLFLQRDAVHFTARLPLRADGHPLPPGRYRLETMLQSGDGVAVASAYFEVVICAYL